MDFNIVKEWDVVIEAKTLEAREAGSPQSGFLRAVHVIS
jgi:hypothetical protein